MRHCIFLIILCCFGAANAQTPPPAWVATLSPSIGNAVNAQEMVVDDAGNSYHLGYDNGPDLRSIIAKVDPYGNLLWMDTIADGSYGDIGLSSTGAIYVCVRVPGGYYTVRYTNDGDRQWSVVHNDGRTLYTPFDLAIGPEGAIHITGDSYGSTGWDATTVVYDSLGTLRWSAHYDHDPSSFGDHGRGIAIDAVGNTYVTGASVDEALGSIVLISYDPNGEQRWVRRTAPGYQSWGAVVAINATDHVIIAGTQVNTGQGDFLCAAFDTAGTALWTTVQDVAFADAVKDMVLDADGNIYITGLEHNSGEPDIATMALAPDGTFRWVRSFGVLGSDGSSDIKTDAEGHIYVAGHGPDDIMPGHTVAYILHYDPEGNLIWLGKYYEEVPYTIALGATVGLDAAGNIYGSGRQLTVGAGSSIYVLKYASDVGIEESTGHDGIVVHHDPAHAQLWFERAASFSGPVDVSLIDVSGKVMRTTRSSDRSIKIETSNLPFGTYVLRVQDAKGKVNVAKVLVY